MISTPFVKQNAIVGTILGYYFTSSPLRSNWSLTLLSENKDEKCFKKQSFMGMEKNSSLLKHKLKKIFVHQKKSPPHLLTESPEAT